MAEITYLMDRDPGASGYFTEAFGYFSGRPEPTVVPVEAGKPPRTLEDVFTDLRTRAGAGEVFPVINMVSHAIGFSSLRFPISEAHRGDDGGMITKDTLKTALGKAGTDGYPAILGAPAVTDATTVCFYGCDVGRDASFMVMLGQLFGPALTIYAPLRAAVFRHTGTRFEHRLARTWAVNHTRDITKTADWGPARTEFVTAAVAKFSGHGGPDVESAIRAAAGSATATSSGSFFLSESLETPDDPATHALAGTSAVLPTGTVDDTTVPITVTSADYRKDPTQPGVWVAWFAVLGQVLEEPVSIDDSRQFRKTVVSRQKTASVNPLVPEDQTPEEEPMTDFYGKYRAVVTDDIDPSSDGRLKVDVPAVGVAGVWAEASIPPVPQSLLRIPAVGATVWVEFEAGDIDLPIWTGALWGSGVDEITLESPSKLTIRAPAVNVESAVTTHSGVVQSDTLITNSVVSGSYTPGAGNLY
jgi:hypothetical protein